MEFWLWSLCSLLICVTILLVCKIHVLKKSAEEISDAFSDRLHTETNTAPILLRDFAISRSVSFLPYIA